MKKKFLMRLVRTSDTSCYIEYSYHRFVPEWTKFQTWAYMLRNWSDVTLTYPEAKVFAAKFKTIEDVNAWKAEQEALKVTYPDPVYAQPIIEYVGGQ